MLSKDTREMYHSLGVFRHCSVKLFPLLSGYIIILYLFLQNSKATNNLRGKTLPQRSQPEISHLSTGYDITTENHAKKKNEVSLEQQN